MRRILIVAAIVFVVVALAAAFLCSQRISIVGRVTDAAGNPVSNAVITGTSRYVVDFQVLPVSVYSTTSDTDGHYRLRGNRRLYQHRSNETYHLQVGAGRFARVHRELEVKVFGANRADFRLEPGGELQGRIVDSRNRPFADCAYYVHPEDRSIDSDLERVLPDKGFSIAFDENTGAKTDSEGRFVMSGIPPDTYRFMVWQGNGYVPSNNPPFRVEPAQQLANMDFVLFGAEDQASLSAKVVGPNGEPVAGFVVAMLKNVRADGTIAGMITPKTEGLPPGTFLADGMDPGTAEIILAARGFTEERFTVNLESGQRAEATFTLTEGGIIRGKMTPFLDDTHSDAHYFVPGKRAAHTCLLHNDGTFFADGIAPARYLLNVQNRADDHPGSREESAWVTVESGRAGEHDFDLSGGAILELSLNMPAESGCQIIVRDRQAPNITDWNEPVQRHEGAHAWLLAKEPGAYTLSGLPEGAFKVAACWFSVRQESRDAPAPGMRERILLHEAAQDVVLKNGETVHLDLGWPE